MRGEETSESPPELVSELGGTGRQLGGTGKEPQPFPRGWTGWNSEIFFDLTPLRARVSLSELLSERLSKEFIQKGFFSMIF